MAHVSPKPAKRQRASSKRALAARERIFDAAETLFAFSGFDGTSIRDIAARAEVTPASVLFHGESKQELFEAVVARRAGEMMEIRLSALKEALRNRNGNGKPSEAEVEDILAACLLPMIDKALRGGAQWMAYVRLVAIVSAEERWREISAACFDPTAVPFIEALCARYPQAPREAVASAYVYTISAALSLATARWRIEALSGAMSGAMYGNVTVTGDVIGAVTVEERAPGDLIRFCAAGVRALLEAA